MSPGQKFRDALAAEKPLQIVGVMNVHVARMAALHGFPVVYLSGACVSNMRFGFPDLGMTNLTDVVNEARLIAKAVDLPLLVDIDTGFGNELMIQRTIQEMTNAGVAAVHMEDQESLNKRCGHREGKKLVSLEEMVERIKVAVNAKSDQNFVVMARTDALAVEGLESTIQRAQAYAAAGADMLFLEAVTDLKQYRAVKEAVDIPILLNSTEFGKTPLYTKEELQDVDMVLYPLTVTRAMNQTADEILSKLRGDGTQQGFIDRLQTREELYDILNYHKSEARLNF